FNKTNFSDLSSNQSTQQPGTVMKFRCIRKFEETITSLILLIMVVAIAAQVFSRYVLNDPLPWAEQLTLFLFAWMIYIGCSQAEQLELRFSVTVIHSYVATRVSRIRGYMSHILTIGFCWYAIASAIQLISDFE